MKFRKNFSLQWHITDKCNLKCKHCYRDAPITDLDLENNIKVFNNLKKLPEKLGMKMDVSLTGGEAITYYKFEELVSFLRQQDIVEEIHLQTNGTLISDEIIQILNKYNIPSVQISIDGTETIHDMNRGIGSFNSSIAGIKKLINNGIKVQVHLVFTQMNYSCVYELIEYLNELGVYSFLATHLVPIGEGKNIRNLAITKEQWQEYQQNVEILYKDKLNIKILKGRPTWNLICDEYGSSCPVGINSTSVLPNGDMLLCRRLPIIIGNLLRESVFKIWYDSDVIWELRDKENLKGKCRDCKDKYKCGGCRALAYAFHNDYLAEDPYCWKNTN